MAVKGLHDRRDRGGATLGRRLDPVGGHLDIQCRPFRKKLWPWGSRSPRSTAIASPNAVRRE
jgi:hypothetical protein